MKHMTVDDYMVLSWKPVVQKEADGDGWCLTIPPLDDLTCYAATRNELMEDWPDALRCHLKAYLEIGKIIPLPVGEVL